MLYFQYAAESWGSLFFLGCVAEVLLVPAAWIAWKVRTCTSLPSPTRWLYKRAIDLVHFPLVLRNCGCDVTGEVMICHAVGPAFIITHPPPLQLRRLASHWKDAKHGRS